MSGDQGQPKRRSASDRGSTFAESILLRSYEQRRIDGLRLAGSAEELEKVEQALAIIREFDPIRYRRICRDLKLVWVRLLLGGLGRYRIATAACWLETRYILDSETSLEDIAATIVHEATHARLHQAGFGYKEPIRSRVENICFRRELAFGKRLPNGDAVIDQANRQLKTAHDYSNAASVISREKAFIDALNQIGIPAWSVSMLVTLKHWLDRWRRFRNKLRLAQ